MKETETHEWVRVTNKGQRHQEGSKTTRKRQGYQEGTGINERNRDTGMGLIGTPTIDKEPGRIRNSKRTNVVKVLKR